jgi:hypothetical protein
MVDMVISDDNDVFENYVLRFRSADPSHECMSLLSIKQQRLPAELKASLGMSKHTTGRKSLGITESQLEQCVASSDPVHFWQYDVNPEKSFLRDSALRVLCAKPSSTAMKKIWSHFRDTFTTLRRSMCRSTLHTTVYTKLNMHLIPHDKLEPKDNGVDNAVPSNYDWVSSILDKLCEHNKELERAKERQHVADEGLEDDEAVNLCGEDDDMSVLEELGEEGEDDDDFILDSA